MQYFFCLILLSCIFVEYSSATNDTDLIRCTSSQCSQVTATFAEPLVLPPQCQDNYENALACGIEYTIDYDKQQITIDFQATNQTGSLEDQKPAEFIVQTVNIGLSKNSTETNTVTRKYGCNTNNDCAKQSYQNTINYFVTEGLEVLDSLRTKLQNDSLIVGTESKRRCIDSTRVAPEKPSVKCHTGICYLNLESFNQDDRQYYKTQSCDPENRPMLFSEIEHHIPTTGQNERILLKYRCNKNVCNRDDFVDKIKFLVSGYTNGTLRLHGDKSISGKNGGSIISQTFLLVLFLFLIQLFI